MKFIFLLLNKLKVMLKQPQKFENYRKYRSSGLFSKSDNWKNPFFHILEDITVRYLPSSGFQDAKIAKFLRDVLNNHLNQKFSNLKKIIVGEILNTLNIRCSSHIDTLLKRHPIVHVDFISRMIIKLYIIKRN